jgi:hypothetical protein
VPDRLIGKKVIPAPSSTGIVTVSCCTRGRCSRKRSVQWQQGQAWCARACVCWGLAVPATLQQVVRERLNATGIAKEPAQGTAPPLLCYPLAIAAAAAAPFLP